MMFVFYKDKDYEHNKSVVKNSPLKFTSNIMYLGGGSGAE